MTIRRCLNWMDKRSVLWLLGLLAAVSFFMMAPNFLWLNADAGFTSFNMLDVRFFFTHSVFDQYLLSLDADMKTAYLQLHAADDLFIITFYPWLLLILFYQLKDRSPARLGWLVIPLAAMMFDLFENLLIDATLRSGVSTWLSGVTGWLTLFKFVMIFVTVSLIILFTVQGHRKAHGQD